MKENHVHSGEGFRTKEEIVPRYLYKYFPNAKNALKVINNGQIHLEAPETYNDIFDGAITITMEQLDLLLVPDDVVEEIVRYTHSDYKSKIKAIICNDDFSNCENMKQVREVLLDKNISKEIIEDTFKNIIAKFINVKAPNNLITCFSETNSSELMWAHYGSHLEGVCLCFDTTLDSELFKHAQKIDYSLHRPVASRGNFNMYFTKSLTWSYEQEWRIVVDREPDDCFISTKSCVGVILGSKLPFENKTNKKVVTEEVNGKLVDKIIEEELPGWGALTIAAQEKQMQIYKAYPDPHEFKIKIKDWYQNEV